MKRIEAKQIEALETQVRGLRDSLHDLYQQISDLKTTMYDALGKPKRDVLYRIVTGYPSKQADLYVQQDGSYVGLLDMVVVEDGKILYEDAIGYED